MSQIWRRLQLLFSVGKGILAGRDRVQVSAFDDDIPPKVMWVEPYGFSYFPPNGGQVYLLFPNGDRSQGFSIVYQHKRYQMMLSQGEVALHDDQGQSIHLTRSGIVVKGAGKPMLFTDTSEITLDAPLVKCTSEVTVGANITATGNINDQGGSYSMSGMRASFDAHVHPGDSGGTTGAPTAAM